MSIRESLGALCDSPSGVAYVGPAEDTEDPYVSVSELRALLEADKEPTAQSEAWEAGLRHALTWLGLKQYGEVMAKDNPHRNVEG